MTEKQIGHGPREKESEESRYSKILWPAFNRALGDAGIVGIEADDKNFKFNDNGKEVTIKITVK